jgi:hypothetical protein
LVLKVVKVAGSAYLQHVAKCALFEAPLEARGKLGKQRLATRPCTPTRVFWEKRLQAVENKGRELQKEKQEAARD